MSKASRHLRDCPAVGKAITSRECGENRGSNYACPAECPHHPFGPANYEGMLEIERRVVRKALDRLGHEHRNDPAWIDPVGYNPDAFRETNSFWIWQLAYERDREGRTFFDRWERQRFDGLNNDERVLLRCLAATRPALLEVQRFIDDETFEAIDLLGDPQTRITLRDCNLAQSVVRFSAILIWVFQTPHYWRAYGGGSDVPEVQKFSPEGVVREVARHLGAPENPAALGLWLAEHFNKMCDAFQAVFLALRHRMLEMIDAKFFKTSYRLLAPHQDCRRRLAKQLDVVVEQVFPEEFAEGFVESFTWLANADAAGSSQLELPAIALPGPVVGRSILGRVLLAPDRIRLEASASARSAPLRARFERALSGMVEFAGERIDDTAAQMRRSTPGFDASLVPPSLLAEAPSIHMQPALVGPVPAAGPPEEIVRQAERRHHERWMDEPVPALDGRTPRQAAADSKLRPKLVQLAKSMVRHVDMRNQREGGSEDINWLIEELGLDEIISPPPPLRPRLEDDEEEGDYDDEEDWVEMLEEEEAAADEPDPPARPLAGEEVERRLTAMTAEFPDPERLIEAFFEEGQDLADQTTEMTAESLHVSEQAVLACALATAYFLLCPPQTERCEVNGFRLRRRLEHEGIELEKTLAGGSEHDQNAVLEWIGKSRQPVVADLCTRLVLDSAVSGPKKHRTRKEWVPWMIAFLKAAVDEIDCVIEPFGE